MSIEDLTAEGQVMQALLLALATLVIDNPIPSERDEAIAAIREAVKRIQEARAA